MKKWLDENNVWGMVLFALAVLIIAAMMLMVLFINISESKPAGQRDWVGGTVTYIHYSNPHSAATHHGDHQYTFQDGVWLKIVNPRHPNRSYRVHVVDVCDGAACRMLDITPTALNHVGYSTSQGVGRVRAYCGKHGNKPMRKCLAGEDK